jgi:hypothetical protein
MMNPFPCELLEEITSLSKVLLDCEFIEELVIPGIGMITADTFTPDPNDEASVPFGDLLEFLTQRP